jgi:N-acetyl-anhydromuramyl-L-alanine amidase AmpD
MDGTMEDTDSWFAAVKSQVSAHYGISRNGKIHQYVQEGDTAWHAGRVSNPTWKRIKADVNPNLYTIGIEHEGKPGVPWTPALYDSSSALLADVAARWNIPLDADHVIGHCDIYSKKPFCPGTGLELSKLMEMARNRSVQPSEYNLVAATGTVTARSKLNVRQAAPTTNAPASATKEAGTTINYTGWTSNGQTIHGNSHWYRDTAGNFVWAGATSTPTPSVASL